jgi:protein-S-isoprenylcysteine O-methyltransferase Ste14
MPVYSYLQIIFFLSELSLLIFKRSKSKGIINSKDRNSLAILWLTIAICSSAGPFTAFKFSFAEIGNQTLVYTGIIIAVIGFIIRWISIIQLGSMFTVDVAITDDHNLKTNGLYQFVRHPSYLGLILIITGISICLNNWLSIAVMVIPSFLAINHRIIVEEQALISEFGEQSINYKRQVRKIIPWLY